MTTPAFVDSSTSLNTVRLYTQFDPYYYTIDNRPLEDINSNVTSMSLGVDAARRAVLFSTVNKDLKDTIQNGIADNFILGFNPSFVNTTVTIGRGVLYTPLAISNNYSDVEDTILKQAFLHKDTSFAIAAPGTPGQSVVYTVEARYTDVSASTVVADNYFIDTSNTSFFQSCINGVVELIITAGTADTTGSEVPPATTAGYIPLINFHISNGATEPYVVEFHQSAPKLIKGTGLNKSLELKIPGTEAGSSAFLATSTYPVFRLADAANQNFVSLINPESNTLNLYKDVEFDISYTSDTNSGNFAVRLDYLAVIEGASIDTSITAGTIETIAAPGTAGNLVKATLTGVIPGRVLATAKQILVRLYRIGGDGGDTAAGNLDIVELVARQS